MRSKCLLLLVVLAMTGAKAVSGAQIKIKTPINSISLPAGGGIESIEGVLFNSSNQYVTLTAASVTFFGKGKPYADVPSFPLQSGIQTHLTQPPALGWTLAPQQSLTFTPSAKNSLGSSLFNVEEDPAPGSLAILPFGATLTLTGYTSAAPPTSPPDPKTWSTLGRITLRYSPSSVPETGGVGLHLLAMMAITGLFLRCSRKKHLRRETAL